MRSISIGIATLFLAVVMESCGGTSPSGADGAAGTGGAAAGAGGTAGIGGGGGDGMVCMGTHPLVDGGERLCAAGECRCEATDTCFPQGAAARCCGGALRCFGADGGVDCAGTHPLVDGGSRSCASGLCYCSSNDTCYAPGVATTCCNVAPSCTP